MSSKRSGSRPIGSAVWVPWIVAASTLRAFFDTRMTSLLPLIVLLLALGMLLVWVGASQALMPFVYPLL
jgi:hypothetical protein